MTGGEVPSSSSRWIDNVCPGFHFTPRDDELIVHFLRRRSDGLPLPFGLDDIIPTLRLYGPEGDPRLLFERLPDGARHTLVQNPEEFFVFTHREHCNGGDRPSRVAGPGTWSSNRERTIFDDKGGVLGSMVHLTFKLREEEGGGRKRSKGFTTNWVMHEYQLPDPSKNRGGDMPRTHRHKGRGSTTQQQQQTSCGRLVLCSIRFTKGASGLGGCSVPEVEEESRPGKRRRVSPDHQESPGGVCTSTLPPTSDLDFPVDHHVLTSGGPPETSETVTPPPTESNLNSEEDPQPQLQQHIQSSELVLPCGRTYSWGEGMEMLFGDNGGVNLRFRFGEEDLPRQLSTTSLPPPEEEEVVNVPPPPHVDDSSSISVLLGPWLYSFLEGEGELPSEETGTVTTLPPGVHGPTDRSFNSEEDPQLLLQHISSSEGLVEADVDPLDLSGEDMEVLLDVYLSDMRREKDDQTGQSSTALVPSLSPPEGEGTYHHNSDGSAILHDVPPPWPRVSHDHSTPILGSLEEEPPLLGERRRSHQPPMTTTREGEDPNLWSCGDIDQLGSMWNEQDDDWRCLTTTPTDQQLGGWWDSPSHP